MLLSSGCLVIAAFLASILLMKLPYHPTRSRFLEWTQSENFNEFLMTSCWLFGRLQSIQPSFVQAWTITAAAFTMSKFSWCYNTLLCHLRLGVAFTNSQSFFIKCDHCKHEKTIQQLLWQCTHSDVQCQPFWSVPEVDLLQRLRSWVLGHINQESYTCSNDSKINQSEKTLIDTLCLLSEQWLGRLFSCRTSSDQTPEKGVMLIWTHKFCWHWNTLPGQTAASIVKLHALKLVHEQAEVHELQILCQLFALSNICDQGEERAKKGLLASGPGSC